MDDPAIDPGTPRWVKVFGTIAVIVALVFVLLHLSGHVPGHHAVSDDHAPSAERGGR